MRVGEMENGLERLRDRDAGWRDGEWSGEIERYRCGFERWRMVWRD
jgi:hypothetical protein